MGVALPATVAFDYPTVSAIASFVIDKLAPAAVQQPGALAVVGAGADSGQSGGAGGGFGHLAAVVGMGLRFPGTEAGG